MRGSLSSSYLLHIVASPLPSPKFVSSAPLESPYLSSSHAKAPRSKRAPSASEPWSLSRKDNPCNGDTGVSQSVGDAQRTHEKTLNEAFLRYRLCDQEDHLKLAQGFRERSRDCKIARRPVDSCFLHRQGLKCATFLACLDSRTATKISQRMIRQRSQRHGRKGTVSLASSEHTFAML